MKIKNKSLNEKSKKWLKRHLDDEFVKKSTSLNYRSRAAYKLLEIIAVSYTHLTLPTKA